MFFRDIIGQQTAIQKLKVMAQSARVPHALMLLGPEGNGGLPLALALAQFIHCEQRGEDSCGVCSSCTKHQKYVHPDVHFTYPVLTKKPGEKPISNDFIKEWRTALAENVYMNANDWLQSIGAENQQGNITVRECHEIIRGLSLKTYEAQFKIQIIWMAEYLKEAGNTLLKVIEEPPQDTIFILIVENIEMMLTTIISRTQLVKVNAIESDEMKAALLNRFEMDDASARRIVRIADGNFNAALTIAAGQDSDNDKLLHQWLLACFNLKQKPSMENAQSLLEWVDEISKIGRENQKIFLKYSLFFLRECALVRLTQKSEKLEGNELQFAQRLSARLEPNQFETIATIINKLSYHIERNANPKIHFLSNSFRIAGAFKQEEVLV